MLLAVYVTVHRVPPVECSQALQLLPTVFVLPSLVTTEEQEWLGGVSPSVWRYGLLPYGKERAPPFVYPSGPIAPAL